MSNETVLSDVAVNKLIQPKFCKIITEYGEGTGYIADDATGKIVSSFHLVGAIKPVAFPIQTEIDLKLICILLNMGYLDSELRLTEHALALESVDEFKKQLDTISNTFTSEKKWPLVLHAQSIVLPVGAQEFKILVSPEEASELMKNPDIVGKILNAFKNKTAYSINNEKELKVLCILFCKRYLNNNLMPIQELSSEEDLNKVFKIDKPFTLDLKVSSFSKFEITVSADEFGKIIETTDQLKRVFEIFDHGNYEKDVSLLTQTVEIQYGEERLFGKIYFPENTSDHKNILRNYAYLDSVPIQIISYEDGTPFMDGKKCLDTGNSFQIFSEELLPQIGEKVYFGGYPLTQQEYTFSVGIISGILEEGTKKVFILEASIVPGNSGSPIFIQRNGKMHWIGVISSEVARVSEEMLEMRNKLNNNTYGNMQIGNFSFMGAFKEIIDTTLNNLSTGKGKAMAVYDPKSLYENINRDIQFVDQYLDFLVPKQKNRNKKRTTKVEKTTEKISLFEYINDKRLTRLTKKNLIEYIRENADLATRRAIFANINPELVGEGYIELPQGRLAQDLKPAELRQQNRFHAAQGDADSLYSLYSKAFLVSEGSLINNLYQYTDDTIPVYEKNYVTQKFLQDHIAGQNKWDSIEKADEIAERRDGIFVSTTIKETELKKINEEVKDRQSFYRTSEKLAQEYSAEKDKGYTVKSIIYQTRETYSMQVREDKTSSAHCNTAFFYSVATKGDSYFMHHFAGTKVKNDWDKLPSPPPEESTAPVYCQFS